MHTGFLTSYQPYLKKRGNGTCVCVCVRASGVAAPSLARVMYLVSHLGVEKSISSPRALAFESTRRKRVLPLLLSFYGLLLLLIFYCPCCLLAREGSRVDPRVVAHTIVHVRTQFGHFGGLDLAGYPSLL